MIERRANLLGGAAEVTKGPQQLDVGVSHGTHGGERALGIPAHRIPYRIELEPDPVEAASGRDEGGQRSGRDRGAKGLNETFDGACLKLWRGWRVARLAGVAQPLGNPVMVEASPALTGSVAASPAARRLRCSKVTCKSDSGSTYGFRSPMAVCSIGLSRMR